jgi:hypothetical protein
MARHGSGAKTIGMSLNLSVSRNCVDLWVMSIRVSIIERGVKDIYSHQLSVQTSLSGQGTSLVREGLPKPSYSSDRINERGRFI